MIAYPYNRPRTRKLRRAGLNGSHALSKNLIGCWFFNEGADRLVINHAGSPADQLIFDNGSTTWVPFGGTTQDHGIFGVYSSAGSQSGMQITTPSSILKPTNAVSMFYRGVPSGTGTNGNNVSLAWMTFTSTNSSPFVAWGMSRKSGANNDIIFFDDLGGSNNTFSVANLLADGVTFDCAMTIDGVSGNVFGYFNGRQVGTANRGANKTLSYGSPIFMVNDDFSGADSARVVSDVLYVWNRPLSAREIIMLHYNPYAIQQRIHRPFFVAPAIAVAGQQPYMDYQMPAILAQ